MDTKQDLTAAQTEADEKLSRELVESLERSLDELDQETLLQLRQARAQALEHPWRKRQVIGSLAVAASVAALVIIPMSGSLVESVNHDPQDIYTANEWDGNLSYLQEDPQMLLDMEMLLAIGESLSES